MTEMRTDWRLGSNVRRKLSKRMWHLNNQYKITIEEYEAMVILQNGVCAICSKPEPRGNLAVDHCHKTNKIRKLLCHVCNKNLGIYETKKEIFDKYLTECENGKIT